MEPSLTLTGSGRERTEREREREREGEQREREDRERERTERERERDGGKSRVTGKQLWIVNIHVPYEQALFIPGMGVKDPHFFRPATYTYILKQITVIVSRV